MEDSPRTFNTLPINYNMTCPSKDQVSSPHKKKHSMILNLGNKNTYAFGVDQTPTPTRFIRNCEEVGLFQDLQNVNPFEETFRKAVESGKTGNLALQNSRVSVVTDDTLHTPHVFPHIIEHESSTSDEPKIVKELAALNHDLQNRISSRLQGGVEEGGLPRSAVNVVRQEADTSQLRPIAPHMLSSGPVQLILQMPDGRLMQVNATQLKPDTGHVAVDLGTREDKVNSVIFHTTVDKKTDSDNISPLIKQKLKARLGNVYLNHQQLDINGSREKSVSITTEQKDKSRNKRLTSNASNSDDDEDSKRRKFLERNRAAAMRCREKRKSWVENLERRADQMTAANQQLQLEVGTLRAEVAQLKTLLLAHKDCPVTRAMCNDQMTGSTTVLPLPVEPLVKPPVIQVTTVQINPLSLEDTALRKTLQKKLRTISTTSTVALGEIPVKVSVPKKKRLSLDIETAKQSHCLSDKDSPLVRSDEYLSSTLLPANSIELETLRDLGKPVATQVIQVNPNVLYRENRLTSTSPNIETPLLPISPQTTCIDYS